MVALSYMIHARLEARFDTIPARLLVMVLAFTQPLVRGWARYYTWLRFKRTPGSVIMAPHEHEHTARALAQPDAPPLLERGPAWAARRCSPRSPAMLETEGWRYSTDTGWKSWDVQIYGNLWWNLRLRTVTEYHGGPKCLTRVRLTYSPGGDNRARPTPSPRRSCSTGTSSRTPTATIPWGLARLRACSCYSSFTRVSGSSCAWPTSWKALRSSAAFPALPDALNPRHTLKHPRPSPRRPTSQKDPARRP